MDRHLEQNEDHNPMGEQGRWATDHHWQDSRESRGDTAEVKQPICVQEGKT